VPREVPFLVLLLTVVFIALGVFGILTALMFVTSELTDETLYMVLLSAMVGAGYLVVAYGLYKGFRWGWYLALAVVALSLVGNWFYGSYYAMAVNAVLFILLLLTAKHYGVSIFGKPAKPATPTPLPSKPITLAYAEPKKKKFVRRKY